ncbi:MAG: polymer-forming cytoskeletal protein [Deltaproteobacteria bacterium]|nr:polymer-forming cytoskeletal protein [Deltaproteobacteria bacterium]MBW2564447.1 polymer-forming cytoskeletal protein [Deltaproteobacteria bacterium]
MKTKLFFGVLLLLFISVSAGAVEVVFDKNYKTENMKIEDDYIFFGRELVFSGNTEDLIFMGRDLDFTGKTKLGLFAFGKEIMVNGKVGNGIASAGENISIQGEIKGTNFMAGRRVVIQEGAILNGTVFTGAAELIIRGKVNGDLYVGAGKVTIENTVNGNIKARTGRLMILGEGKVNGNLTYTSDKELSKEELAKVTGSVNFEKNETSKAGRFFKSSGFWKFSFLIKLLFLVAFIASGLLFLFLPPTRVLENQRPNDKFWFTSLYGLIPLFMYPALIVVSALLVITLPLTGVLLLSIIPIFFITKVLGVTMLGQYLSGLFKIKKENRFLFFLIGMVCLAIFTFIPFINFLFAIFIASLGFGLITSYMFKLKTI